MWLHMKTISQINNQNLGFALIWLIFYDSVCQTGKGSIGGGSGWLFALFGHMLSWYALFVVLI